MNCFLKNPVSCTRFVYRILLYIIFFYIAVVSSVFLPLIHSARFELFVLEKLYKVPSSNVVLHHKDTSEKNGLLLRCERV